MRWTAASATSPPTDPNDSRFVYVKDCGTNDMTASTARTLPTFVGNKVNYEGKRCPNVVPRSNFYQYSGFVPRATSGTDYDAHWCANMRSSADSKSSVSGYEIGTSIKFKAGYRLFSSPTGNAVSGGISEDWLTYTMIEASGAVALTVSMAASAIVSLTF